MCGGGGEVGRIATQKGDLACQGVCLRPLSCPRATLWRAPMTKRSKHAPIALMHGYLETGLGVSIAHACFPAPSRLAPGTCQEAFCTQYTLARVGRGIRQGPGEVGTRLKSDNAVEQ